MTRRDTRIAVLGDGGWGTALSLLLSDKGFSVNLWGAFEENVEEIRTKRENGKFLPGFKIPEAVRPTSDLNEALEGCRVVVLAVPSQFMRPVLKKIGRNRMGRDTLFVSVAKGIETSSLKVMSELIREILGPARLAVISGPSLAREVALKMPAAVSVASRDHRIADQVRELFQTEHFSLYLTDDVLGVELGGAVKNVIAIAVGIAEGLGFGSNTRAAIFARGAAEMARLGKALGSRRETFMGLSGIGDLATTCLSPLSRNRTLGECIGKGEPLGTVLKRSQMVVEGVETCKAAYRLAKKKRVAMPITEAVYGILFRRKDPKHAVEALLTRVSSRETD